jgi:hypothetical protein
MNIIFGTEQAEKLRERFTVLELDTFLFGTNGPKITAYCVVEGIPIDKLPLVESWQSLHEALMKNYQQRNWNYCTTLIEQLMGAWNLEMDSFYDEVNRRIVNLIEENPGEEWTPVINRPIGASF